MVETVLDPLLAIAADESHFYVRTGYGVPPSAGSAWRAYPVANPVINDPTAFSATLPAVQGFDQNTTFGSDQDDIYFQGLDQTGPHLFRRSKCFDESLQLMRGSFVQVEVDTSRVFALEGSGALWRIPK